MFSSLRLSASGGKKKTKKAQTLLTQTLNLRQQLQSCHLYNMVNSTYTHKHKNFNLLTFDTPGLNLCLPLEPNGRGNVDKYIRKTA